MSTRHFIFGLLVCALGVVGAYLLYPTDALLDHAVAGEFATSTALAATSSPPFSEAVGTSTARDALVTRAAPSLATASAIEGVNVLKSPASKTSSGTSLMITQGASLPPRTIVSGEKDIPVVHFVFRGGTTKDTITAVALGSDDANGTFNYLENMRLVTSTGRTIDLTFKKLYMGPYPLYSLSTPVAVPQNAVLSMSVLMDAKPGLAAGKTLRPVIVAGAQALAQKVGGYAVGGQIVTAP